MHASIGPLEVAEEVQHFYATPRYRVEDSNFDVRMLIEQEQMAIGRSREHIIEQETNKHTAVGRLQQGISDDEASCIRLHEEILEIDALLGPRGEIESGSDLG